VDTVLPKGLLSNTRVIYTEEQLISNFQSPTTSQSDTPSPKQVVEHVGVVKNGEQRGTKSKTIFSLVCHRGV